MLHNHQDDTCLRDNDEGNVHHYRWLASTKFHGFWYQSHVHFLVLLFLFQNAGFQVSASSDGVVFTVGTAVSTFAVPNPAGSWYAVEIRLAAGNHLMYAVNGNSTCLQTVCGAQWTQSTLPPFQVFSPNLSSAGEQLSAGCLRSVRQNSDPVNLGQAIMPSATAFSDLFGSNASFVPPVAGCPRGSMCVSRPCLNGGTCSSSWSGSQCQCPSNFQGTTCSQGSFGSLSPAFQAVGLVFFSLQDQLGFFEFILSMLTLLPRRGIGLLVVEQCCWLGMHPLLPERGHMTKHDLHRCPKMNSIRVCSSST